MSIIDKNMLGEFSVRLPIDGLPYQVQQVITTYAKALNCPTEFVTGAAMAAAAQAAGDRFVWSNGQYTCYPQFFTALLGDSTANKTSAIRKMFKPWIMADNISLEQRREAVMGKSKEEKARTPYLTNLLQDTTTEAYQDARKFNNGGVTLLHDELPSFFDFNRYRKGNDEKFYCSRFANYDPFNIARKGEGIETIPHPIVRVIGGIQPEVLATNFATSEMLADGMLPRFLWYAVPDDFRFDETGITTSTHQEETYWCNITNRLLNHQGIVRLDFDNEAQQLYTAYKIAHSKAKNTKTLFGYEAAVCGKLEIYAIIWAMTSRILRAAAEEATTSDTLTILGYDMQHSLNCMNYFQQSAMQVYHTITEGIRLKPADCIRGLGDLIKNQSQFAESIGYSHQAISKLLKGR